MDPTIEDLFKALGDLEEDGPLQATSLRLPKALHEALSIATELGMDASVSAATREALTERIRGFARQTAFSAHFAVFPDDIPRLAEVAKRQVSGTDHPAAAEPGLVDKVAAAEPVIYEGALGVKSAGRFLSGSVAPRSGVGGRGEAGAAGRQQPFGGGRSRPAGGRP